MSQHVSTGQGFRRHPFIARFYESEASKQDEQYYDAVKKDYQLGRTDGIDATLKKFALDAIIMPSSYGASSFLR